MKIADLFVELGIEGDNKAVKGIKNVESAFGKVLTVATLFTGAVTGAFFGLSKLTKESSDFGADMKKFSDITGLSTKQLQKWEHAGRRASVSGESIRSSLASLQDTMASIKLGEGNPMGMDYLGQMVKDFDPSRMDDTFYMMEKIQEMVQKIEDPAIARKMAGSFGIDSEVISAMRNNSFTPDKMLGESLVDSEIEKLKTLSGEWKTVFHSIEVSSARFVSRFGDDVIGIIKKGNDLIGKFSDEMIKLSESKEFVEGLSVAFDSLFKIMKMVYDVSVVMFKSEFIQKALKGLGVMSEAVSGVVSGSNKNGIADLLMTMFTGEDMSYRSKIARPRKDIYQSAGTTQNNNNIVMNINGAKDPKATAEEVDKKMTNMFNKAYVTKAGGLSE